MNVTLKMLQQAEALLNDNAEIIARKQSEILNIGCSMCANCSGIVGD